MAGRLGLERLLEPVDELALLGGKVHRRLDHHTTEQVPARATAHRFHALVAQPEHAARLSLGGNLQRNISLERRHVDRTAEGRGGKAHGNLAAQVHAIALEDWMLADVDLNVQIPRGTPIAPSLT